MNWLGLVIAVALSVLTIYLGYTLFLDVRKAIRRKKDKQLNDDKNKNKE